MSNPRARRSKKSAIVGQEAEAMPRLSVAPYFVSNRPASPPGEVPERRVRYCIDLPLMVLAFRDNHQAAVTIQAGEIFEVVGPAQDDRFVVVHVRGEQFLAFDCDLKDHGKPIPGHKPRRAAGTDG